MMLRRAEKSNRRKRIRASSGLTASPRLHVSVEDYLRWKPFGTCQAEVAVTYAVLSRVAAVLLVGAVVSA